MGQQQLLLLVLGIVIVGLAVVVGIQAFDDGRSSAALDAIRMDMVKIVSDNEAYADKPAAFGGPAVTGTLSIDFTDLGYTSGLSTTTANNDTYTTANGSYVLTAGGVGTVTVTSPNTNTFGAQVSLVYDDDGATVYTWTP